MGVVSARRASIEVGVGMFVLALLINTLSDVPTVGKFFQPFGQFALYSLVSFVVYIGARELYRRVRRQPEDSHV